MKQASASASMGALLVGACWLCAPMTGGAQARSPWVVPDVQLEEPGATRCDDECESTRLRLGVDLDLRLRIELAERFRDLASPPRRRYGPSIVVAMAGLGAFVTGLTLLFDQDTLNTRTGATVGFAFIAAGSFAFFGGVLGLLFRAARFHRQRMEWRNLLDAGVVRW